MRNVGTCLVKSSSILIDYVERLPLQLNRLLQVCSDFRALVPGKQIHQQVVVNGFRENQFVSTKLVQMYADCDDIRSAHEIFDRLSIPNVFAWTACLSFFLRNGEFEKCIYVYKDMKRKGVSPDNYVFPKVLKACAAMLCLEGGIQLHKDVYMYGSGSNVQVCNALLDMYTKCGEVESGKRVFDDTLQRDLLSWNSMISGYVANGFLELAIDMFSSMRLEGVEPDVVTWNTVMDAYCRMGQCDEAANLFCQIDGPNIISWTTLISGYFKTGKYQLTLEIFRNMLSLGEVCADLDCISRVLASCQHMRLLSHGRELHAYGIKDWVNSAFYKSAGPALLALYAKCGRTREAGHVFDLMDRTDVITWNARICGFSYFGTKDLALDYFKQMQSMGLEGDHTTNSSVLSVCELKSGREIHVYVLKKNWGSIILVWNSLIHMYARSGSIYTAHLLFSQMESRDLVSWNTMIGGFGVNGLGEASLQLLEEMKFSGMLPNSLTFTSVLTACSHSGLVDEGLKILQTMRSDYGIDPGKVHFVCVVDLLARAGRLENAVDLILKMPYEADKHIWGSVLTAALAQQKLTIGVQASEQLVLLEPENAGHFVTLSNLYAKMGRRDEAIQLRKTMEGRGVMKQIGYSCIAGGRS